MTQIPSDQLNSARSFIEQSQDVLIAIGTNPNVDSIAAALALYLVLSTQGKRVSVVCPDAVTVNFSHLVGVDKISTSLSGSSSGRNLVISFPYEEGSIEKVSYNIEGSTFNLVIEPRENYPTITQEMIRYTFSGGNTDTIITVGVGRLTELNNLYQNNQGLFVDKPVINIDINASNGRFGRSNIVDSSPSSISELVTNFISQLGYQIDADIATNLLQGISAGSQNFTTAQTSAATFEAAALCLNNGARRSGPPPAVSNYQFPTMKQPKTSSMPFGKPTMGSMQKSPSPSPFMKKSFSSPPPMMQSQPMQQQPRQMQPPMQPPQRFQNPSQPSTSQPNNGGVKADDHAPDAPPDWLKPKIYKGSTLL